MEIRNLRVGSYQTNCYIVWGEGEQRCVLIDPGYAPEEILEQVRHCAKTVEAILLTHGHFDHVGGVKHIAAETGCSVYICKEDLSLNPVFTDGLIHYTDTYAEGDTLELAGLNLQVLHTPGHTPGCVCLKCGDVLFSGDTLFAGTCGRTDLPGGSPAQMKQSLARLKALEGDLLVLPGHGDSSSLEEERRSNPYMQGL
jgi:glyoxylase-like metal-dependent hydrolase (beta-lactamase superfamily II)